MMIKILRHHYFSWCDLVKLTLTKKELSLLNYSFRSILPKYFAKHNNKKRLTSSSNLAWKILAASTATTYLWKGRNKDKSVYAVENLKRFNFIADVAKDVFPSVVNVKGIAEKTFGRATVTTGSGFIVRSDGLIITSASLIGKHTKFMVRLLNGQDYVGEVVAVDGAVDLAALKIETKDLPAISLNKHNNTRVGEWVMAYGSPLALKNSITVGIVSNVHRAGQEIGQNRNSGVVRYLQTDAIINNGNSGGPLVNLAGEVIGINTLIASTGISFAIPVDYVETFVKKVTKEFSGVCEQTTRKWIGIRVLSLSRDIILQIHQRYPDFHPEEKGLFIDSVNEDSPAFRAGLQHKDIIMEINGKTVSSSNDIHEALCANKEINLTIKRKDKLLDMIVVADEINN